MYFNENMSSFEARNLMYQLTDGKTNNEIEQIKNEYKKVAHKIYQRELVEYNELLLTSDRSK